MCGCACGGIDDRFDYCWVTGFCDPSVYIKSRRFQAAWNCRIGYLVWLGVCGFISGYGYVYDWLLSMCFGSFIIGSREMCCNFVPYSFVNASWRVWRIVG
jgi:hypothetical protein